MWFSLVCTLIDNEYGQWSKYCGLTISDDERNVCQDLLTIENSDLHSLHYANELLDPSDLPFKNFIYSWHLSSFGSCYCKKKKQFTSVLLLKKNFVKFSKIAEEPLRECYDVIYS